MDLNYLLYRHQLLLVRAASPAASPADRAHAVAKAGRIRRAVECWRAARIEGPRIPIPRARA